MRSRRRLFENTRRRDFTRRGLSWSNDRWGWPDDFAANLIFDWAASDAAAPLIGETLTLHGATPGIDTDPLGQQTAIFDGTNDYYTTQNCDPGATEDLVMVSYASRYPTGDVGEFICSTRPTSGRGVAHYAYWPHCRALVSGDSTVTADVDNSLPLWGVFVSIIDRGSNEYRSYFNGTKCGSSPALPSGDLGEGAGLGIACDAAASPASSRRLVGRISRVQVFRGVGLGARWTDAYCYQHAAAVLGVGRAYPLDFVIDFPPRGGLARAGEHFLPSPALSSEGIAMWGALENKCYKNAWLVSGDESCLQGTMTSKSVVASTSMPAAIKDVGNIVYRIANSSGGSQICYYGDVVTAGQTVYLSVRSRIMAGSAELGLYGTGFLKARNLRSGIWDQTTYILTTTEDSRWALNVAAGSIIQFILATCVVSAKKVPEVLNLSLVATATKAAETLVLLTTQFSDARGLVEIACAPDGWGGGDDAADRRLVECTGTPGDYCHIDDSTSELYINDGTNEARQAIAAEAAGVQRKYLVRWGGGRLEARAGIDVDSNAYDGTMGGVGVVKISCSDRIVSALRI